MKARLTFHYTGAIIALLTLISLVSSCDSENEPNIDENAIDHIIDLVSDGQGNITLIAGATEGEYLTPVEDSKSAKELCRGILSDEKWVESKTIITFPNGAGLVKITQSDEEGVFYDLFFNIIDMPQFILKITTYEYFENENRGNVPGIYWKCSGCGAHGDGSVGRCPVCGGRVVVGGSKYS